MVSSVAMLASRHMMEPGTPEPSLPAAQPPPLPPRLEIEEVSKSKLKWVLELHPDHFTLQSEFEPRPLVFTRGELWEKVEPMLAVKLLAVKKPRAITFRLPPEAFATFSQWLGPLTSADLRRVLNRRYAWVLPIAALLAVTSLPMLGDPEHGVDPVPFDPLGLALGVLLGGIWVCARWRPMRIIFLVDAIWFTFAAARIIYLTFGVWHTWRLVFSVWLLILAGLGVRWFLRFGKSMREERRAVESLA